MNRFDKHAAEWDSNPVRREMARAVARKMMGTLDLNPSVKALEIGSGTGLVTLQLAPHVGSVTALDSSENMLSELKKKMEVLDLDNITPMSADLEKDPIPGGPYDLVFCNMVFHHIKYGDSVIQKVFEALAPGGRLVITDLDAEDGNFHGDNLEAVHHFGFSRDALLNTFEKAGFKNCTVEDAHVIEKKDAQGDIRSYPMFMAMGVKPAGASY